MAIEPVGFDDVLQKEKQCVDKRRAKHAQYKRQDARSQSTEVQSQLENPDVETDSNDDDLAESFFVDNGIGLALSGGGIRSACFSLGILQGLARKKLWGWIDYLSTVSGGGYTGSMVSSYVIKSPQDNDGTQLEFLQNDHHQTTAVRRMVYSGQYLQHPIAFLSKYLIGVLLINTLLLSILLALSALLALSWRWLFDTPAIRNYLESNLPSLNLDLWTPFFPAIVLFLLWGGIWFIAYLQTGSEASPKAGRWAMSFMFAAVALGFAIVLGNGDLGNPLVWAVTDSQAAFQIPHGVSAAISGLIIGALLPLLNPKRLMRSGVRPQTWWEPLVFRVTGSALLLGIPLIIIGWIGKENISGHFDDPSRPIICYDISDNQWPALIGFASVQQKCEVCGGAGGCGACGQPFETSESQLQKLATSELIAKFNNSHKQPRYYQLIDIIDNATKHMRIWQKREPQATEPQATSVLQAGSGTPTLALPINPGAQPAVEEAPDTDAAPPSEQEMRKQLFNNALETAVVTLENIRDRMKKSKSDSEIETFVEFDSNGKPTTATRPRKRQVHKSDESDLAVDLMKIELENNNFRIPPGSKSVDFELDEFIALVKWEHAFQVIDENRESPNRILRIAELQTTFDLVLDRKRQLRANIRRIAQEKNRTAGDSAPQIDISQLLAETELNEFASSEIAILVDAAIKEYVAARTAENLIPVQVRWAKQRMIFTMSLLAYKLDSWLSSEDLLKGCSNQVQTKFLNYVREAQKTSDQTGLTDLSIFAIGLPETSLSNEQRRILNKTILSSVLPKLFYAEPQRRIVILADQKLRIRIFKWSLLVAFVSIVFLDLNTTSMHKYYRDRLAKTFIVPDDSNNLSNLSNPKLSSLKTYARGAPYHLINAKLTFPLTPWERINRTKTRLSVDENDPSLQNQDNPLDEIFLFSQQFCGAAKTGYARTEDYESKPKGWYSRIDLAEAMALSGAAITPAYWKSTFLALLSLVLNLRLGQWLPAPKSRKHRFWPAPFLIWRDMFRSAKEREYCFVSDGGHVENLGFIPLLQRRCKIIIVADGSADPTDSKQELSRAMRMARLHLGIQFHSLENNQPELSTADWESNEENKPIEKTEIDDDLDSGIVRTQKNNKRKNHFALAVIKYPPISEDGETENGLLIHIRPVLTGDESIDVTEFNSRNWLFPNDSTGDQFFEPDQVEAYRNLGEHSILNTFLATDINSMLSTVLAELNTSSDKFDGQHILSAIGLTSSVPSPSSIDEFLNNPIQPILFLVTPDGDRHRTALYEHRFKNRKLKPTTAKDLIRYVQAKCEEVACTDSHRHIAKEVVDTYLNCFSNQTKRHKETLAIARSLLVQLS